MLTSQELKSYAHLRRIRLIDQAWKDYLQDLTLHLLYKKIPPNPLQGRHLHLEGPERGPIFRGPRSLSRDDPKGPGHVPHKGTQILRFHLHDP